MKVQFYCSDSLNPYHNLALEQSLFSVVDAETRILFLWQNANTIVVGRNQNVDAECRAEAFLKSGGQIARRRSGGGAVYHDRGNLNISLIGLQTSELSADYRKMICAALRIFSLEAEFNGRNDLLIKGKKFSGTAAYTDERICCEHGTVLINSDITAMTSWLTPDAGKLARNYVSSVEARVANLKTFSPSITKEKLEQALIAVAKASPLCWKPDSYHFQRLKNAYANPLWILEGKPVVFGDGWSELRPVPKVPEL